MKISCIIVLVTARDHAEAQSIAQGLLTDKLIACANIVDNVQSLFWWKKKVDQSREVLLILKTKKTLFRKICTKVKKLHSYDTPEIIALPIMDGSADYLKWIRSSTC